MDARTYDRIKFLLPRQRGKSRGGFTTKIHTVVADVDKSPSLCYNFEKLY